MLLISNRSVFWIALITAILLTGCGEPSKQPDLSGIKAGQVSIMRYEHALFSLNPEKISTGLDSIHEEFHFFLGNNYKDTLNIIRIQNFLRDPMIRDLKRQTDLVFPSLQHLEAELGKAFRYWKHYFPSDIIPQVYSYISGLYYESPVEFFDSIMIISLDLFLGPGFEPYRAIGLPKYMTRRMRPEFITPECMKQVGISLLPDNLPVRTLLDQMVLHGKILYFLDQVLPDFPDTLKIGFTPEQEQWCRENEKKVWTLMLEKDMLYSADPFVVNKFIQDGPFTSGLPEESPAMLGRWIGWQIVRGFMKTRKDMSLSALFALSDSQSLLTSSRYKPSR